MTLTRPDERSQVFVDVLDSQPLLSEKVVVQLNPQHLGTRVLCQDATCVLLQSSSVCRRLVVAICCFALEGRSLGQLAYSAHQAIHRTREVQVIGACFV
ncbi:hypothetical protein FQZ97_826750 [compost metagenome]